MSTNLQPMNKSRRKLYKKEKEEETSGYLVLDCHHDMGKPLYLEIDLILLK